MSKSESLFRYVTVMVFYFKALYATWEHGLAHHAQTARPMAIGNITRPTC